MKLSGNIECLVDKYMEGECSAGDLDVLGGPLAIDANVRDYYFKMLALNEDLKYLTRKCDMISSEIVSIELLKERERRNSLVVNLASVAALVVTILVMVSIVRVQIHSQIFMFSDS